MAPPEKAVRRFRRSRSANVGVMAAIFLPLSLSLAAVAVDQASLYVERREGQALTDLAAIAAAASPNAPAQAALAVLAANGLADARLVDRIAVDADGVPAAIDMPQVVVTPGRYAAGAVSDAAARFTPNATPANAARVTLARTGTLIFGERLMGAPVMTTHGVGANLAAASFSIGSRLASLDGGLANALLGGLLGARLSLQVMDYDALIEAKVSLDGLLSALGNRLHLTAASYDDVLDAEVSPGLLASAMATAPGLSTGAKSALAAIARDASGPNASRLRLRGVIDLGDAGRHPAGVSVPGLSADVGVMELLTASAAVANGQNQLAVSTATGLPGLASVSLDLAVGEPPQHATWFSLGSAGTIVRTAQTRLRLSVLLGSKVLGAQVEVPLYVEVAYGEARLADVACANGRPDSAVVKIEARPGVVEAWIGEIDPAALRRFERKPTVQPAVLVDAVLATVSGSANASMTNVRTDLLAFSAADIAAGTPKSVSTRDFTSTLTGSLLGNLSLKVKVLGLGLGLPSNVTQLVSSALAAATPSLDGVLSTVLGLVGVKLGEADIRVHSVACGRPVLVQ